MRVHIEEARRDHLPPILEDIRPADLREWVAGTGSADIQGALEVVFREGRYARAACDPEGTALCMWGIDELEPGVGWVWMFATTRAVPLFFPLHRHLRAGMDEVLERWPTLHAYSDSRNTIHHRWLKWLDFTHSEDVILGPYGLHFKHFIKEA